MRLRAHDGSAPAYTVTPDDALWLARAVEAEGAVASQVAAVLVNGFMWNRARGGKGTLTDWVRAYAQPVNPRWYPNGDIFLKSQAQFGAVEQAQRLTKARQREHVHSTRTKFSNTTQAAILAALNGRVAIPLNAVDYAAPDVDASDKKYTALEPKPATARNRLWTRPGAEQWGGYLVDATDAWPWLVGVLLLGFWAARKWGGA